MIDQDHNSYGPRLHAPYTTTPNNPIGGASTSPLKNGGGGGVGRRAFLTPNRVAHRHSTLIDAFHTADRKQRGHLPYDRILEIYALYFHASVGQLQDEDLAAFVEKFARHSGDGSLVVEYSHLADALKKRDLEMMAKAEARALRQTGSGGPSFTTPERPSATDAGRMPPRTSSGYGGGVAAALRMQEEPNSAAQHEARVPLGRGHYSPLRTVLGDGDRGGRGGGGETALTSPVMGRRERGMIGGSYGSPPGKHADLGMGSSAEAELQIGGGRVPLHQMQTQAALGVAEAGTLLDLLAACEAADEERGGRLHGAQLLTCCRMHGISESSSMLRAMISDSQRADGRVDYVAFVQQLAAQRASGAARSSVAQAFSSQQ